ncbi:hypothetical protein ACH4VS_16930 [Streptomyces hygroscopicus]|uniref:hypothetical protein n=1 Tax=Streptomyces hygroscopicus TaxID=1912 RepID=UPI000AD13BBD|nr:hypothetical protein Shyhy02_35820 [Streptomyces hygroscopicus subsp. hygroscopicus]
MPTSRPRGTHGARGPCPAVLDPATGEVFDEASARQPDARNATVGRAHGAWRSRRATPVARTTASLPAAAALQAADAVEAVDALQAARARRAAPLPREQGNPLAESVEDSGEDSGADVAGGPRRAYGNRRPCTVAHRPREACR